MILRETGNKANKLMQNFGGSKKEYYGIFDTG